MTRTLLVACLATACALGEGFMSGSALAQDAVAPVRIGGNVQAPKKIKNVAPVYPLEAQQAGVSGSVVLEIIIGADGRVQSTRVIRSVPLLDRPAVEAVAQWEFVPTLLNGSPVPVIMTVTVNFALDDRPGVVAGQGPDGRWLFVPGSGVAAEPGVAPSLQQRPGTEAGQCLPTAITPEQADRRETVMKFLEDVNAKQRTVFIARQGKGYAPRLEQLPGLPPLEGFDVQLVADGRVYTVSVKDKKDQCGRAFFSDHTGSIYIATRTR